MPPVLLDLGRELDGLTVDPALARVLTEAGWDCDSDLRQRWLRLAVVHASYLHEHRDDLPVNARLLPMLGSLGLRWCRVYMLEEFLSRKPLASASEQSRAYADCAAALTEHLGQFLHVGQATLLGRGEAITAHDPRLRKRTHGSVAMQIIGVMCLLGGLSSVSKLTRAAYRQITAQVTPATDWVQLLNTHSRTAPLTWHCQQSGPEHQRVFEATVTDRRRRTGRGSANTKSGARSVAAEDFIRRYLPAVTLAKAQAGGGDQRNRPARPAAKYINAGIVHEQTLGGLRENFGLPRSAEPLLAQALTHASWTNEHQDLVKQANQRDHAALAHLGSAIADALIAHEQVSRIVSHTLEPTEDEARFMSPRDQRFWELFEDLQLRRGLLLSAGAPARSLPSICAESMQAVLSVAWQYNREGLLARRPRQLDEWLKTPNAVLDPSTSLQQLCSEFKVKHSFGEFYEKGPDHNRMFAAVLRFADGPETITIRGPFAPTKTEAKHGVSRQALAALDTDPASRDEGLHRFLLRRQVLTADTAESRRCLLRGWLGVSHLASADLTTFGKWADDAELAIGPLTSDDLGRLRSSYQRCLLISRRGSLPLLRSMFTEATEWLQQPGSAAQARSDPRWLSFHAVARALGAITAEVPGSVRGVISGWYGSVIGRIEVGLSSERLGDDLDDLTPAQAAALRSLLDAASGQVADGRRLHVAVYRQDRAAHVAITSDAADLHPPLSDLVRLLDECVSSFACVQIERGWLIETRYLSPVTPTRLADLGKALEASADQRSDLLPLAKLTEELLGLVDTAHAEGGAQLSHQVLAADLFRRRGSI